MKKVKIENGQFVNKTGFVHNLRNRFNSINNTSNLKSQNQIQPLYIASQFMDKAKAQ